MCVYIYTRCEYTYTRWMQAIFKVFIEFVATVLLFYVSDFWARGMWDLSPLTRDRTSTSCREGEVLTTGPPGKRLHAASSFAFGFCLPALCALSHLPLPWGPESPSGRRLSTTLQMACISCAPVSLRAPGVSLQLPHPPHDPEPVGCLFGGVDGTLGSAPPTPGRLVLDFWALGPWDDGLSL